MPRVMPPFDFFSVPRIVFGRGKVAQLGDLARSLNGSAALIIYNGPAGNPLDRATESLKSATLNVLHHRQKGEPTTADVDSALAAARSARADLIVGLGGGSAIDCAKAVAGLLTNGGAALDYMEVIGKGRKITRPAAPWIAVPTTAGTGAEVTRNAVIGSPEHKYKASLRSEHLLARAALVDPELGVDVPADVTAASGMDALVQLIESYTSNGANILTQGLSGIGLPAVTRALLRAYETPNDIDARTHMAQGALISGITLTNAGLGAVHGLAAPIGAHFPIPHGIVCARLVPHVVQANMAGIPLEARQRGDLWARYFEVAVVISGSSNQTEDLPAHLATLVERLHIPTLGTYGLREEHIPEMVALAKKSSSMRFNPVALDDQTLADVLRAAL